MPEFVDEARYATLLREIESEFPGFRIVSKSNSRLQFCIHGVLLALTLGGQRRYLTHYVTTIGRTVYVHHGWDDRAAADRWMTMRHERVHLQQFQRLGLVPLAVLYLFVPLPLGLAWCRARLERQAYEESMRAMVEVHGAAHLFRDDVREYVIAQFTGPAYGWMWPFRKSVERWYDCVRAKLVEGTA